MRNVIVFGNVPLATWIVERLIDNKEFNLIGVVCDQHDAEAFQKHGMKEKSLHHFCTNEKIKMLTLEEAGNIAREISVLGISVRYHQLFKKEYIMKFTPGIVNLHGGELPRYRGANIANYAVYEDAERVGGTLHFVSEGIDEGDIIERVVIPIEGKFTAFEFFTLTIKALKEAFLTFISREDVVNQERNILSIPQIEYEKKGEVNRIYYKKLIEANRIKEYSDIRHWDELYRLARAYTFPGHKGFIVKNGDELIEMKAIKND